MTPPVLITRSASTVRGVRKTTMARRLALGETSLLLVLVVLISLVSLLYLVHSNKSATKGYAIKVLDNEYDDLVVKNEVWNMRIAEAKAMRTILAAGVIRRMVNVAEIQYVTPQSEQN